MTGAATFAFAGDLLLAERAHAAARAGAPERVWGDTLPVLQASDGVFVNLEGPITGSTRAWRRGWKWLHLRSDPAVLGLLTAANVRFASLANNHILDYEVEGLRDTVAGLDATGIAHAGAGENLDAAAAPALVSAGGLDIGVIAFTDRMIEFAAGPGKAGTFHVTIDDDVILAQSLLARARALRDAGADIVIVSAHWGPNLWLWPSARYRRLARALVDGGVDVFHGHSAHYIQGVEIRPRGAILFDTGDFLDDVWHFPFIPSYWSCLFLVEFENARFKAVRAMPVQLRPGRVDIARGAAVGRAINGLLRRSRWVARDTALGPRRAPFARPSPGQGPQVALSNDGPVAGVEDLVEAQP
jgi:poly-gamma-glutamate synthesis protein (capsule biosynthesis protein)